MQFPETAGNRPTHDRTYSVGTAPSQDDEQIFLLYQHGADQRDVSPLQIGICQRAHVRVDEALRPVGRQQGSNREQPQRWIRGALALKRQSMPEAPVRVRPFRIYEKSIHVSLRIALMQADCRQREDGGFGKLQRPYSCSKDIEQGVVNPNLAVIFDEAQFSETIHKNSLGISLCQSSLPRFPG